MLRTATLLVALAAVGLGPARAADINVTADISVNTTWTADNTYFLDGLIFVDEGVTLTIQAGTVIKGREQGSITTGDGASALIVRRGATILAAGTADAPIIFTAEIDDVTDPFDTDQTDRGLWGGVVVLGRAPTNANDGAGTRVDVQIEGIPFDPGAGTGDEAQFGGSDPQDDSGILRYVSIRHGGFSISGVEGDEINGLTLGAVGSETVVEYVEVYANLDDCFEWFGGTVNTRFLAGAFCGDDTFDYDLGFTGKGQFWFSLQGADIAGRAGEHDSGSSSLGGEGSEPVALPVLSNATYLGSGRTAAPSNDDANNPAIFFRDNAGGQYHNAIFADFPAQALRIEDLSSGADSRARLEADELVIAASLFADFGAGSTLAALVQEGSDRTPASVVAPRLAAAGSAVATGAVVAAVSREADEALNPRPVGEAASGADFSPAPLGDAFFEAVGYRGAFDPAAPVWLAGWSVLDTGGFLSDGALATAGEADPVGPPAAVVRGLYPNPVQAALTVELELAAAADVRMVAYDLLGREAAVLADGPLGAGAQALTVDTRALAPGTYVVRVRAGEAQAARTVTVVR